MVEVNGSEDILNVPLEFLAVVSAFAVFLLVVFVYVNKKWRFLNVGPITPLTHPSSSSHLHHHHPHHHHHNKHPTHLPSKTSSYRNSSKIDEDYATSSSPEPTFDSEEDLNHLRHNHHQLHYHPTHHHDGMYLHGSPGGGGGGPSSSSTLMASRELVRESSLDDSRTPHKVMVSGRGQLQHSQSLQHQHQQQLSTSHLSSSSSYKPLEVINSTLSYLTSAAQNHLSSSASSASSPATCPPPGTSTTTVPSNMSSSNVKSSNTTNNSILPLTASPSLSHGLGHGNSHGGQHGCPPRSASAMQSHPISHMLISCGTPDPLMSSSVSVGPVVSTTSQNIRPLRVSSIRDVDDMCSRRRTTRQGMIRSNTGSGRSSAEGHHHSTNRNGPEGNDLISLAEQGKVNGSSESSTSSNASADDDLHRNHHAHLHHNNNNDSSSGTNNNNNHLHQSTTLFHPHPVTLTRPSHPHRTLDRTDTTSERPLQTGPLGVNSGTTIASTSSSFGNLNHHHRRMAMPPRIKSVDSESPPPSEQELSTYGDSIADRDDHIFEVEDMSLVGSDLGLTLGDVNRVNPTSPLQCGSLEVAFDYEAAARKMTVHIIQARGVPAKDIGGANNTHVRIVLLPSRKQKHKTKVRPGENPSFMESFVFSKINPEDVSSFGIRFRLYGCERIRRERLLGECILGFESLHLELETILWLNLEPRYHLTCKSKSECGSLARSDSASSSASIQNGIPELLVGLAYNGTTGRLTVEVIKGSFFRNLAGGKAPDSYVKLVLVSSNGHDMGRAKTSLRRSHSNPLFKETFMFQVALFQISEVTLLVSLYGRKGVTRRELLGWFAFGSSSSGDEETTHWEDMCDAQGDQICRWHVLLQ